MDSKNQANNQEQDTLVPITKTVKLKAGLHFKGQTLQNLPNGLGKLTSDNEAMSYIGTVRGDSFEGLSKLTSVRHQIKGRYADGQLEGITEIVDFDSGTKSISTYINGKMNGVGVQQQSKTRSEFRGYFKNGLREGFGVEITQLENSDFSSKSDQLNIDNQQKFKGFYTQNMKSGPGILITPTKIIQGDWSNDKLNPLQRIIDLSEEISYTGNISKNQYTNFGFLKFNPRNGNQNNSKRGQKVIKEYSETQDLESLSNKISGDSYYLGEYLEGKKEGLGKESSPVSEYLGYFECDKRHGTGLLTSTSPPGTKDSSTFNYYGQWELGKREGRGVAFSPNFIYSGSWKNDKFDGKGAVLQGDDTTPQGFIFSQGRILTELSEEESRGIFDSISKNEISSFRKNKSEILEENRKKLTKFEQSLTLSYAGIQKSEQKLEREKQILESEIKILYQDIINLENRVFSIIGEDKNLRESSNGQNYPIRHQIEEPKIMKIPETTPCQLEAITSQVVHPKEESKPNKNKTLNKEIKEIESNRRKVQKYLEKLLAIKSEKNDLCEQINNLGYQKLSILDKKKVKLNTIERTSDKKGSEIRKKQASLKKSENEFNRLNNRSDFDIQSKEVLIQTLKSDRSLIKNKQAIISHAKKVLSGISKLSNLPKTVINASEVLKIDHITISTLIEQFRDARDRKEMTFNSIKTLVEKQGQLKSLQNQKNMSLKMSQLFFTVGSIMKKKDSILNDYKECQEEQVEILNKKKLKEENLLELIYKTKEEENQISDTKLQNIQLEKELEGLVKKEKDLFFVISEVENLVKEEEMASKEIQRVEKRMENLKNNHTKAVENLRSQQNRAKRKETGLSSNYGEGGPNSGVSNAEESKINKSLVRSGTIVDKKNRQLHILKQRQRNFEREVLLKESLNEQLQQQLSSLQQVLKLANISKNRLKNKKAALENIEGEINKEKQKLEKASTDLKNKELRQLEMQKEVQLLSNSSNDVTRDASDIIDIRTLEEKKKTETKKTTDNLFGVIFNKIEKDNKGNLDDQIKEAEDDLEKVKSQMRAFSKDLRLQKNRDISKHEDIMKVLSSPKNIINTIDSSSLGDYSGIDDSKTGSQPEEVKGYREFMKQWISQKKELEDMIMRLEQKLEKVENEEDGEERASKEKPSPPMEQLPQLTQKSPQIKKKGPSVESKDFYTGASPPNVITNLNMISKLQVARDQKSLYAGGPSGLYVLDLSVGASIKKFYESIHVEDMKILKSGNLAVLNRLSNKLEVYSQDMKLLDSISVDLSSLHVDINRSWRFTGDDEYNLWQVSQSSMGILQEKTTNFKEIDNFWLYVSKSRKLVPHFAISNKNGTRFFGVGHDVTRDTVIIYKEGETVIQQNPINLVTHITEWLCGELSYNQKYIYVGGSLNGKPKIGAIRFNKDIKPLKFHKPEFLDDSDVISAIKRIEGSVALLVGTDKTLGVITYRNSKKLFQTKYHFSKFGFTNGILRIAFTGNRLFYISRSGLELGSFEFSNSVDMEVMFKKEIDHKIRHKSAMVAVERMDLDSKSPGIGKSSLLRSSMMQSSFFGNENEVSIARKLIHLTQKTFMSLDVRSDDSFIISHDRGTYSCPQNSSGKFELKTQLSSKLILFIPFGET